MARGSTPWWRSRRAGVTGVVLLAALAIAALGLVDRAGRTDGDEDADWTRVGAEVLAYRGPATSKDQTGVVSVAYRAGSSEMRADIETRYDDFGPTVDVEYDPTDPGDVRVAGEGRRTGDLLGTLAGAVAVGAVLMAIIVGPRVVGRWVRRGLRRSEEHRTA